MHSSGPPLTQTATAARPFTHIPPSSPPPRNAGLAPPLHDGPAGALRLHRHLQRPPHPQPPRPKPGAPPRGPAEPGGAGRHRHSQPRGPAAGTFFFIMRDGWMDLSPFIITSLFTLFLPLLAQQAASSTLIILTRPLSLPPSPPPNTPHHTYPFSPTPLSLPPFPPSPHQMRQ